jgi:hypothetical protein
MTNKPKYYFRDLETGVVSASGLFRTYTFYAEYDGDKTITFHMDGTPQYALPFNRGTAQISRTIQVPKVIGTPSLSNLTKYIDLDVGECYAYQGGQIFSWNNSAILPSDLLTLASGANTVTFDNTVTDLKVVPRWWKI